VDGGNLFMSITKLLLLVLGAFLLIAGVMRLIGASFGIDLILPLLLIVVGFLLISGRGISL
jgi:hypothetical protein